MLNQLTVDELIEKLEDLKRKNSDIGDYDVVILANWYNSASPPVHNVVNNVRLDNPFGYIGFNRIKFRNDNKYVFLEGYY